jgi:hypothetical protein
LLAVTFSDVSVTRPLQTWIVGRVRGTIAHPESKDDRQMSQDPESKKQTYEWGNNMPAARVREDSHVQPGARTPADPSPTLSRTINCTSKQDYGYGRLLRCSFKLQVPDGSISLVTDSQMLVTGYPEAHAPQGMVDKSRQRDLDALSIGQSNAIHHSDSY